MNFVTPAGFRDILPEEARLREEIASRVQRCLADRGFASYRNSDVGSRGCHGGWWTYPRSSL